MQLGQVVAKLQASFQEGQRLSGIVFGGHELLVAMVEFRVGLHGPPELSDGATFSGEAGFCA
jgi:hypothetical protein